MGRFSVGQRVKNPDGDLCEVIGKPKKGVRELRKLGGHWDGAIYWADKSSLEPANDNAGTPSISAEISESAYSGGDGGTVSAWVPKVGDRVRVVKHCNWRGGSLPLHAPVGSEHDVTEMRSYFDDKGVATFLLSGGGHNFYTALNVEPVVAPATTWAPVAGKFGKTRDGRKVGPMVTWTTGVDHPWEQKNGDNIKPYLGLFSDVGKSSIGTHLDLVAEWVEPVPVEVAVAEATATPWGGGRGRPGLAVHCEKWDGALFTPGRDYTFDARGEVTANEGSKFDAIYAGSWSLATPAAPPAKFKVGDRVVIAGGPYLSDEALPGQAGRIVFGATLGLRGDWQVELKGGLTLGFNDDEIAPSISVGATVTFTATGRLSAYTTDGHAQIVFPGLTPGQNSFALPAKFVALAN
jgi:hypothetical protein